MNFNWQKKKYLRLIFPFSDFIGYHLLMRWQWPEINQAEVLHVINARITSCAANNKDFRYQITAYFITL